MTYHTTTIDDLDTIAENLVEATTGLHDELVTLRRTRHDLTTMAIARRMGTTPAAVRRFEAYDANPTLSSVRRYAMAIGAGITITVTDALAGETGATSQESA